MINKTLYAVVTVLTLSLAAQAQQFGRPQQPVAPRQNQPQPLPQNVSDRQIFQVIQVLENTKNALLSTNHNYGLHKRESLNSIARAQNDLLRALSRNPTAGVGQAPNFGPRPEPQNIADARLAEAIRTLQNSMTILSQLNGNYNGQKNAAIKDLETAITHLNRALRFSQRNN